VELALMGTEFLCGNMRVLWMDGDDGYTTLNVFNALNCALKVVRMISFQCILPEFKRLSQESSFNPMFL
jgi:hypothetical protein